AILPLYKMTTNPTQRVRPHLKRTLMAKTTSRANRKGKGRAAAPAADGQPTHVPDGRGGTAPGGENISGYFRKLFASRPELLDVPSNQEVFDHWLRDHPGQKEVPTNVKQAINTVKSILRRRRHLR